MSTRTWGVVAGFAGAAMGAYWWVRKQTAAYSTQAQPSPDRGEVIFHNNPLPADGEGL